MQNIPEKQFQEIQQKIQRSEGTFQFTFQSEGMFDKNKPGGKILEIPAGGHVFKLDRTDDLKIKFYHASPRTKTRVAEIDLNEVEQSDKLRMTFTWSPEEIQLYVGPLVKRGKLHAATGRKSDIQFQIGEDGSIFQLGDTEIEVMAPKIYKNGKPLLLPSALDSWKQTTEATKVLQSGTSKDGYLFEVVISNMIISTLVTGFETYTKTRFLELEKEGVVPDTD